MAAGEQRRRSALILSRISRLRRRLNNERRLRQLVLPCWCAATAVALWRLLLRDHTALTAAVVFLAAFGWWLWRARRTALSVEQAAVLLDRSAYAGGLLLTWLELPIGVWELDLSERVRASPLPRVRRARPLLLCALSLAFLVAALWVPLPKRKGVAVNAAAATKVAQVEARAEALAKEVPLEEGVEAELARLREELADGQFDAADWEAADHLDAELARKAAEAAAQLAEAQEAAKALDEAMSRALNAEGAARERDQLERALLKLDPGAEPEGGGDALDRALEAKGGEGNSPQRSQVQSLKRALEQRRQELAKAYGQGQGQGQAQGQGEGRHQAGEGFGQSQEAGSSSDPQRGGSGSGRGGGPGELTFGANELHPERLAFAPLPEGNGGEKPGPLWGLKAVDPRPSTEPARGNNPTGVAVRGDRTPGSDQGALLPRNRELIRRYFDSQPPSNSPQ